MQSLNPSKNLLAVLVLAILTLSFGSCAKKVSFQTSPYVPAAEGKVKIKKDRNNNYNIQVFVRHLAEPEKLDPPRDNYVVWSDTESNGIKNIGQITSSSGLISKTLKASLRAVSPFKPNRIFITAESNGNVQFPGAQIVLTTSSFY